MIGFQLFPHYSSVACAKTKSFKMATHKMVCSPAQSKVDEQCRLCVYGFIRKYCISCTMPDELKELCLLMYGRVDLWDVSLQRKMSKMWYKVDRTQRILTVPVHIEPGWRVAFGSIGVEKGCLSII